MAPWNVISQSSPFIVHGVLALDEPTYYAYWSRPNQPSGKQRTWFRYHLAASVVDATKRAMETMET